MVFDHAAVEAIDIEDDIGTDTIDRHLAPVQIDATGSLKLRTGQNDSYGKRGSAPGYIRSGHRGTKAPADEPVSLLFGSRCSARDHLTLRVGLATGLPLSAE